MRILVTGAAGFIGRQIVASLARAGYEIICCVKDERKAARLIPKHKIIPCDFTRDVTPETWEARLNGVHMVINCAGVLQEKSDKKTQTIHETVPKALFKACENKNIAKVIQISAQGANADADTVYARTKHAADEYLQSLDLNWIILKPSLVFASGSYGGTSLFRGLAALPGFIPVVGSGQQVFQPIHIKDLAEVVVRLVEDPDINHQVYDVAGTEVVTQEELLHKMRKWLGFKSVPSLHIPTWIMIMISSLIELFSKGPVSTTSIQMLNAMEVVDSQPLLQKIKFKPQTFSDALFYDPSYVQDRWHARLYFLAPILRVSIGLLWLLSGLLPLLEPGQVTTIQLLENSGVTGILASVILYGGCGLDILLGIATLLKVKLYFVAKIQLVVIVIYTLLATFLAPMLWLAPLGSLVKNIPIFVATIIMIAVENRR